MCCSDCSSESHFVLSHDINNVGSCLDATNFNVTIILDFKCISLMIHCN